MLIVILRGLYIEMAFNSAAERPKTSSLSVRGFRYKSIEHPLAVSLIKYQRDKYDKDTNPQVIISCT